jgi:hypothetical protein
MGAVQGSWRFGERLSCFASYTVVAQLSANPLPSNAVSGPLQTIAFGIAYSMRARRNFQ